MLAGITTLVVEVWNLPARSVFTARLNRNLSEVVIRKSLDRTHRAVRDLAVRLPMVLTVQLIERLGVRWEGGGSLEADT